jgi:hypothetical protein
MEVMERILKLQYDSYFRALFRRIKHLTWMNGDVQRIEKHLLSVDHGLN